MIKKLSVIIPVSDYTGQPWRKKALAHVLKRIASHMPNAEVITVCQVAQGIKALGNATLSVEIDGEFCKSKLMNAGAACASGDVLLFLDADVVLKWSQVLETVNNMKRGTVYKPFSTILKLDEQQTTQAYKNGNTNIRKDQANTNILGGGAVLICAEDFKEVPLCEEFKGMGLQDVDWGDRLKRKFTIAEIPQKAYHLYHEEKDYKTTESYKKNLELYTSRKPPVEVMGDTALIFAYYGDSELRRNAVMEGLSHIIKLDPMPNIYFAEVGTSHFKGLMESKEGCHWVGIEDRPEYENVFIKESLYNKVAKENCRGYKFLIFGDPDCWTGDLQWAEKTKAELIRLGHNAGVQPFGTLLDDRSGRVRRSYASSRVANDKRCPHSPGGYWAFHSDFFFNKMNGFNTWCLPGSGDAIFVIEHVQDHRYPTFSTTDMPCYEKIMRKNQPSITLGVVHSDFIHCFHGECTYNPKTGEHGRGYAGRWHIIQMYGDDALRDNCYINDDGILAWKDQHCSLKLAIARKGECESKEDAEVIVHESNRGLHLIRECDHNAVLDDPYYEKNNRFSNYYVDTMLEIRKLPDSIKAKPMLEIGSYKLPLNKLSYRMDLKDTGVPRLTLHDAGKPPYPYAPKQFSVVVASHILEHIGDKQSDAITEFSRIADYAVIALPYMWEVGSPHHLGIDAHTIHEWIRVPHKIINTVISGHTQQRQIIMTLDFTQN